MHKAVRIFFEKIKRQLPNYFNGNSVLDCGSLDINGNNRFLFNNCQYLGIDIVDGKNVDCVTRIHEYNPNKLFDTIISSEMLEHDEFYANSLYNMYTLLKSKGLLVFTAAGTNRPEHGTTNHHPGDSPLTHNYYKNITASMIAIALPLEQFSWFEISYLETDIRFAGIKR